MSWVAFVTVEVKFEKVERVFLFFFDGHFLLHLSLLIFFFFLFSSLFCICIAVLVGEESGGDSKTTKIQL